MLMIIFGDDDGNVIGQVDWYADETGFHPTLAHLPKVDIIVIIFITSSSLSSLSLSSSSSSSSSSS